MQTIRNWLISIRAILYNEPVLGTILIALFTLIVLKSVSLVARRIFAKRFSAQFAMLGEKMIWYGGVLLVITTTLNNLGVNLTAVLGAAGIAGIAIGFASQSSTQ